MTNRVRCLGEINSHYSLIVYYKAYSSELISFQPWLCALCSDRNPRLQLNGHMSTVVHRLLLSAFRDA